MLAEPGKADRAATAETLVVGTLQGNSELVVEQENVRDRLQRLHVSGRYTAGIPLNLHSWKYFNDVLQSSSSSILKCVALRDNLLPKCKIRSCILFFVDYKRQFDMKDNIFMVIGVLTRKC